MFFKTYTVITSGIVLIVACGFIMQGIAVGATEVIKAILHDRTFQLDLCWLAVGLLICLTNIFYAWKIRSEEDNKIKLLPIKKWQLIIAVINIPFIVLIAGLATIH